MSYKEFLETKQIKTVNSGFSIEKSDINPMLFGFQSDIVKWAIEKGKACIFADCGLGKTPMQLEWAYKVNQKENKPVIIFAPLAVSLQTKREGEKFNIPVNICASQSDIVNGINITNYEKIDKFDLDSFCGIVIDESSILKSFTGKYKQKLVGLSENIKYKLACTATPSPKRS